MAFRWEEELRQSFQANADVRIWSSATSSEKHYDFIESTCSEGRADWVWATSKAELPDELSPNVATFLEQPACSRILGYLCTHSIAAPTSVYAASGVSRRSFARHLNNLLNAGLIRAHSDDLGGLSLGFSIPHVEFCSFEFKLHNWRRALIQARRYRSFSCRVYVVMPPAAAGRALDQRENFGRLNVGLISHCDDGNTVCILQSPTLPPAAPAHYIRAIGSLLRHDAKPARRAKSEIAFPQLRKCSLPVDVSKLMPALSKTA